MKVGVLVPDRGDRPEFLQNCWRMIQRQTLQPHHIELVNDAPISDQVDITWRYRLGYSRFNDVDVIAFMENDDWYSPIYLETMVKEWEKHGRPDLFGTDYTIYYHIRLRAYYQMEHFDRASAMNTLIKPNLKKIVWPPDHEPYTDSHLWNLPTLRRVTFRPEKHIAIGIKHGIGKCGGESHATRLHRYLPPRGKRDNGFLKETLDAESLEFYSKVFPIETPNESDFLPSKIDQ